MTVFVIRHVASGQIMPLAKRNRGYSHWNPSSDKPVMAIFTDIPRIFLTDKSARATISQWLALPNGRQSSYQSYDGEWDDIVDSKPDGRAKTDLEVIPAVFEIRNPNEVAA